MYSGGSCSKVAEYSGNTNGIVSRSVLGKGWPKELVKVLTSICTCVHVLIHACICACTFAEITLYM